VPIAIRPTAPATVPTGPGFDVVLLLHVAAVVAALGSVVVTGIQAGRMLAVDADDVPAGVVGYFAPGVNWVGRTLYAVPLLGLALVALSRGAYGFGDGWVQWGIGLWAAAVAGAEIVLWPAERRVQAGLAASVLEDRALANDTAVRTSLRRACMVAVVAACALTAVLIAAIVVMVVRP
jgi:hypothetical protein